MNLESRIWTIEIADGAPQRLDKALTLGLPEEDGLSRSRVAGLIRAGCVRRGEEEIREPSAKTRQGDVWTIECCLADPQTLEAEDLPLDVLYEDADLIVIDKPAGLVVHPGRGHRGGTLVNALLHRCGDGIRTLGHSARPGIVHRLDKDTSGVMVAAKTDRAMFRLSEQFRLRTAARRYHAAVRGTPSESACVSSVSGAGVAPDGWMRVEGAIDRHPVKRQRMAVVSSGGRDAVTRLRLIRTLANGSAALVECRLETGRTHQIRVHLEHIGHPVIGDQLYGTAARLLPEAAGERARDAAAAFPRQALHAVRLEFSHPADGRPMRFESAYPDDMTALLAQLSCSGKAAPGLNSGNEYPISHPC